VWLPRGLVSPRLKTGLAFTIIYGGARSIQPVHSAVNLRGSRSSCVVGGDGLEPPTLSV